MSDSRWSRNRGEGHRLVVTVVRAAERLQKAADRFLRDYGITVAQFNLLAALAANRDSLPQSEIGTRLVVSRANVTGLVGRLQRLGLCRVDLDAADGRIRRVRLTPEGRRLLDRIEQPYFREIRRLTRGLEAARLQHAVDTLERLLEQL
ncbi:MAG: MarR family transcriptional regulator [Planctomycetes bacterium]|nr:MarR family transcriptional regulator [Planctomycetota bacterium]